MNRDHADPTTAPVPPTLLEADQREREREDEELRRIRAALRASGHDAQTLAARMGIGNLTMSNLLTGQQRCSRQTRVDLAQAVEALAADAD